MEFLLGWRDLEMSYIQKHLEANGIKYRWLQLASGQPLRGPGDAYKCAWPTEELEPILVVVEAKPIVPDQPPAGKEIRWIDHHFPEFPGYHMPPEKYWEASSLGQVLKMLGLEPSEEDHVVAASDHNLVAAYDGRAGVDPELVLRVRVREIAEYQKCPPERILEDIKQATEILKQNRGPQGYADLRNYGRIPQLLDAACKAGIPAICSQPDPRGPEWEKITLIAAPPDLVEAFLAGRIVPGLEETYGVPVRGFAGGLRRKTK